MQNPQVSNPNDFKVVTFHNSTDFGFTPEMGCMYDSRPINGSQGGPGINAGESLTVPYHIGKQLSLNLAKIAINRTAPAVDLAGIPTGVPLWDDQRLKRLQDSYLTDLYTEDKPVAITETDRLMAKVEEYKKMVDKLLTITPQATPAPAAESTAGIDVIPTIQTNQTVTFQDKQEVIAELEKRGVKHDKRKNKAELEKLLA